MFTQVITCTVVNVCLRPTVMCTKDLLYYINRYRGNPHRVQLALLVIQISFSFFFNLYTCQIWFRKRCLYILEVIMSIIVYKRIYYDSDR